MKFERSGRSDPRVEAGSALVGADATTAELWRSTKQIHAKAAHATQSGHPDHALELLDGLMWRLQNVSPDFASQEIARTHTFRALALRRLGRFEQAVAACDLALEWYCGRESRSDEFPDQIDLMLKVRMAGLESTHIDDVKFMRLLEESIDLMRSLPGAPERAEVWLAWTNKLIKRRFECGDTTGAVRGVQQVVLQLPTLGVRPVPNQITVRIVLLLASSAVAVAESGEPELASQLIEQCSLLLNDVSSIGMSDGERLTYARLAYAHAVKLEGLGVTDSAMTLFALALGLCRAVADLQKKEAKQRWLFASCLNSYAWALAGRGASEAALPTAQEAVEWARGCVEDEPGLDGRGTLVTLAESLDTLATIRAQLGDLDAAREPARESQTLKRQLVDSDHESSRSSAERTDKLVELIERGPSEDHAAWLRPSAP